MAKKVLSGFFAYDENVCCTSSLSPKKVSPSLSSTPSSTPSLEKSNNSSTKENISPTSTKTETKTNMKKIDSDPFFFY